MLSSHPVVVVVDSSSEVDFILTNLVFVILKVVKSFNVNVHIIFKLMLNKIKKSNRKGISYSKRHQIII